MIRRRRLISTAVAAVCSATLVLTSCGTPENRSTSGGSDAPLGDPVAGGTLQAIQGREPLSLDPSDISNVWTHSPLLGNALYGTLITNNVETQEIEYSMATDFSTADGGQTFTLELRPGLQFTDGTPLDAAAVEYNWDRLRDPSKGSASLRQAEQIADVEAVDADTLNVTLASPNPTFPNSLLVSALNWIASPTALEKGREAFDKNPVGAGPFTLTEWARQDVIQLVKNPEYWDAPRPYLDGITLRTVPAADQRLNTLSTGGADLASESNWLNLSKSESLGLDTEIVPMGGGQYFAMNTRRAPFDDERARRAVNLAADMEGVNLVAFEATAWSRRPCSPRDHRSTRTSRFRKAMRKRRSVCSTSWRRMASRCRSPSRRTRWSKPERPRRLCRPSSVRSTMSRSRWKPSTSLQRRHESTREIST